MPLPKPNPAAPMMERTISPRYAASALTAIGKIRSATEPAELLDRLASATAAVGATAAMYSTAVPESETEWSTISVCACDPGFAAHYCSQRALMEHPWLRFARTSSTCGTDRQVQAVEAADEVAIQIASRHGFKSFLVVPTLTGSHLGRIEMLCLGSSADGDFDNPTAGVVLTLAHALAAELHGWMSCFLRERLQSTAGLREQDVELLALERQGRSTKEISHCTGMTLASVNSRFQRLSLRLNCPTRKASAQRAAAYGLLETVPMVTSVNNGSIA